MLTSKYNSLADALRGRIGWKRSKAGNLTKLLPDGHRLTVFRHPDGTYRRCCFNPDTGTSYDDDWSESEGDALEAANSWIDEWYGPA